MTSKGSLMAAVAWFALADCDTGSAIEAPDGTVDTGGAALATEPENSPRLEVGAGVATEWSVATELAVDWKR